MIVNSEEMALILCSQLGFMWMQWCIEKNLKTHNMLTDAQLVELKSINIKERGGKRRVSDKKSPVCLFHLAVSL